MSLISHNTVTHEMCVSLHLRCNYEYHKIFMEISHHELEPSIERAKLNVKVIKWLTRWAQSNSQISEPVEAQWDR